MTMQTLTTLAARNLPLRLLACMVLLVAFSACTPPPSGKPVQGDNTTTAPDDTTNSNLTTPLEADVIIPNEAPAPIESKDDSEAANEAAVADAKSDEAEMKPPVTETAPAEEKSEPATPEPEPSDVGQTEKAPEGDDSEKLATEKPEVELAAVPERAAATGEPREGAAAGDPQDWTYWRGPEFNGISRATGLPDAWDPEGGEGSNVKWKREDMGTRSTPVAMNGKLFFLMASEPGTPREGEKVVCLDAETGETIWENRFNVYLSDVPLERVGWSSVTADPETNQVYALGVSGHFQCLDADTGETVWLRKMHEQYGMLSTYGGRTNFPVVHEDLVILSGIIIGWGEMAKPAHRFIGFDKRTGAVHWFTESTNMPKDTTYSAPSIKNIGGVPQFIIGAGDGHIWSLQPRTGKPLWNYAFSARGLYATPLVHEDTVYMGQGEENVLASEEEGQVKVRTATTMGGIATIDATKRGDITISGEKWKIEEVVLNRSTPLLIDDYLYVIDDRAKMFVFNIKDGEQVGDRLTLSRAMFSSALYADGKIYALSVNGQYFVIEVQEEGKLEILSKGRLPRGEESLGSPICAQGRIYVPTTGAMYCLEAEDKEKGFAGLPESQPERPVDEDREPAQVQVIPAEVLVKPGEKVDFTVRVFNAGGQLLEERVEAGFQVEGPGKVTAEGSFEADNSASHQATYVTAKVGEISGRARIRVVPDLPWKFDFEDTALNDNGIGEPPVTWVGMRYRHVIREEEGEKVMVKVTTIPVGTRSQGWMGHTDLHDYTIQADVMGHETGGQLPEIGVIAQGYQFVLNGNQKNMQVRSWVTQMRMAKEAEFILEPEVWYTMKLKVSNVEDKALVQGKVWKQGDKEPDEWSVEAEDTIPNVDGSPGLFGNATNGEIFLDNIMVTPNE
ncbi:MAG: PQQ-binding-like beta-propeller repeat protein [Pirellulaceae bacterium]